MFDGKYLEWNQKRIKGIIDFYGHQFMFQKKILDLGCGHADVSGALYRLGADVTAVDARQEHLKIVSKKFPGIKTVKADLDRGWPFAGKRFDMILHLDLLCHLDDYEKHLRAVCNSTTHLILETAVCDSDDPYKCVKSAENKNIYDLSVNGISSRPSSTAIERILRDCGFIFKRRDDAKFNSGQYSYNWYPENNGDSKITKRRIWFAIKDNSPFEQISTPDVNPILPTPPTIYNVAGPVLKNTLVPIAPPPVIRTITSSPTKNVKAALCISGHLRTFEANYQSVKTNILDRMDCDVFIHTWDILGMSYRWLDANLHVIDTNALTEKIQAMYKPKALVIEKTRMLPVKPIMHQRVIDHRDVPGILSMFYKIEECNKLKKEYEIANNMKYDCVIRFRGDLFVEHQIPIGENTNLNHLYIPMYGNFNGICDQFAFGNSEVMDKYSSIYTNLEKYLIAGAPMHPERMMQYHIQAQGLSVVKTNFRYLIKRANGLIQDNMLLERALGMAR
jgi:SAM-dependent methyltransferase